MLHDRLIGAAVGLVLFFAVMFSDAVVLNIAVACVIIGALLEVYKACGFLEHKLLLAANMLLPIVFIFLQITPKGGFVVVGTMYAYVVLLFAILITNSNKVSLSQITSMFTLTVMISLFFLHIIFVRQLPHGVFLVWLIFVGAWLTDTSAYFCGRAFGKVKLAPNISPKKTVEGSIGGVVGCVIGMLIYGLLVTATTDLMVVWWQLVLLGLLCGVVSQIGDLSASAIKRDKGIKDYGNIIFGHGGIMDRFDSVMFVAPLVFYFLSVFPILR